METVVDCQLEPRYPKLQGERAGERGKSSFFQTRADKAVSSLYGRSGTREDSH